MPAAPDSGKPGTEPHGGNTQTAPGASPSRDMTNPAAPVASPARDPTGCPLPAVAQLLRPQQTAQNVAAASSQDMLVPMVQTAQAQDQQPGTGIAQAQPEEAQAALGQPGEAQQPGAQPSRYDLTSPCGRWPWPAPDPQPSLAVRQRPPAGSPGGTGPACGNRSGLAQGDRGRTQPERQQPVPG